MGRQSQVCPENKGRLETSPSGVEFSAAETEAVLEAGRLLAVGDRGGDVEGKKSASLASARAKFGLLGMTEDLEVMARNLDFIFRERKKGRPLT